MVVVLVVIHEFPIYAPELEAHNDCYGFELWLRFLQIYTSQMRICAVEPWGFLPNGLLDNHFYCRYGNAWNPMESVDSADQSQRQYLPGRIVTSLLPQTDEIQWQKGETVSHGEKPWERIGYPNDPEQS